MTGWLHVENFRDDPLWGGSDVRAHDCRGCGCTTPTPDPTSPCGRKYLWTTGILDCMWFPGQHPVDAGHPHVPTRCTCGHDIERVP